MRLSRLESRVRENRTHGLEGERSEGSEVKLPYPYHGSFIYLLHIDDQGYA